MALPAPETIPRLVGDSDGPSDHDNDIDNELKIDQAEQEVFVLEEESEEGKSQKINPWIWS